MKVYTDKVTAQELPAINRAAFPGDSEVFVERASEVGTRKRARAFDVHIAANRPSKRATWIEWGDWMVELLKADEDAQIIAFSGHYDGAHDFVTKTQARANADGDADKQAAADRWSEALYWAREGATDEPELFCPRCNRSDEVTEEDRGREGQRRGRCGRCELPFQDFDFAD